MVEGMSTKTQAMISGGYDAFLFFILLSVDRGLRIHYIKDGLKLSRMSTD